MRIYKELMIIMLFSFFGEIINKTTETSVPGSVIGLILLLLALLLKIVKLEDVEEVGTFMVENLAFFFIPAGVGLITAYSYIKNDLIALCIVTAVSTIFMMVVTGHIVQFIKKAPKNEKDI